MRDVPAAIERFDFAAAVPTATAAITATSQTVAARHGGSGTGSDSVAGAAAEAGTDPADGDGAFYALAEDALYAIEDRTGGFRRVLDADRAQLSDRNISALAVDPAGRLWVGYFDRGLDILSPSGERLTHVEDEHVFCVNRIVHDREAGITAVATANGLVLFDGAGRQKQVIGRAQGLIADHVTDLIAHAGRMTIATPAGLTFIDRDGSRSLSTFHGLVNNHVYALGAAGAETLVGTLGGASVLDNGAIQASYTTANSALTHNWITAIARVDDEWFVGTYGGGLFHLDAKDGWRRFPDLPGLEKSGQDRPGSLEINPNALVVTDSQVFAGTLSQGLLVYNRQARRWTTMQAGLPSLNVTAVAADSESVIVGTDNGIVRLKTSGASRP
jgi:ligand-binding sensor domain-containing protein